MTPFSFFKKTLPLYLKEVPKNLTEAKRCLKIIKNSKDECDTHLKFMRSYINTLAKNINHNKFSSEEEIAKIIKDLFSKKIENLSYKKILNALYKQDRKNPHIKDCIQLLEKLPLPEEKSTLKIK